MVELCSLHVGAAVGYDCDPPATCAQLTSARDDVVGHRRQRLHELPSILGEQRRDGVL